MAIGWRLIRPILSPAPASTAMGRFKHENCEMVVARDGHIVA